MCLSTSQYEAKRTAVPIICYKTARLITEPASLGCTPQNPVLRSMYFGFSYRLNKRYSCKGFNKECDSGIVNDGFHSYRDESRAFKECDCTGEVMMVCRIPAGALYYKSDNGDKYCSNKIEVLGWKPREEAAWHGKGGWHVKGGQIKEFKPSLLEKLMSLFRRNGENTETEEE